MNDALLVSRIESLGNLARDRKCLVERRRTSGDHAVQ